MFKGLARSVLILTLVLGSADAFARAKKKAAPAAEESAEVVEADESMNAKLVAGSPETSASTKSDSKADILKNGKPGDIKSTGDATAAPAGSDAASTTSNADGSAAAPIALVPTAEELKKAAINKLPENEIPVLASAKAEKKADSNPFFKIITTLGVLAITLGAAAYGLKRLAKRGGKKAQQTQIRVLTNHHLGPKKSLQIIQVAGETLLIGVTDHNITMLKTLALIDDEVPANLPQKFNHSMEDFAEENDYATNQAQNDYADEEEPIAMRGLDQIRDTVSARLKNMRNL